MRLLHTPKSRVAYVGTIDDAYPEGMEVEIGDEVEFQIATNWGTETNIGEITAIMPKKLMARVVYLDGHDWNKLGQPRRKVATLPIADLTLIARGS